MACAMSGFLDDTPIHALQKEICQCQSQYRRVNRGMMAGILCQFRLTVVFGLSVQLVVDQDDLRSFNSRRLIYIRIFD